MKQQAFCMETVTLATKGHRLLVSAGLSVRQKRSHCGRDGSCAFDLLVPAEEGDRAAFLLRQAGLPVLSRREV